MKALVWAADARAPGAAAAAAVCSERWNTVFCGAGEGSDCVGTAAVDNGDIVAEPVWTARGRNEPGDVADGCDDGTGMADVAPAAGGGDAVCMVRSPQIHPAGTGVVEANRWYRATGIVFELFLRRYENMKNISPAIYCKNRHAPPF